MALYEACGRALKIYADQHAGSVRWLFVFGGWDFVRMCTLFESYFHQCFGAIFSDLFIR